MELQQCWTRYVKAEELLQQGHWPEAQYLFKQVLDNLPSHVHKALEGEDTRPCQFVCLMAGVRDASISQSSILNSLGEQRQAFETLNQCYALMQFLSLEQTRLVEVTYSAIEENIELVLRHMEAFCASQHSQEWTHHFNEIQKAHYHFSALKPFKTTTPNSLH